MSQNNSTQNRKSYDEEYYANLNQMHYFTISCPFCENEICKSETTALELVSYSEDKCPHVFAVWSEYNESHECYLERTEDTYKFRKIITEILDSLEEYQFRFSELGFNRVHFTEIFKHSEELNKILTVGSVIMQYDNDERFRERNYYFFVSHLDLPKLEQINALVGGMVKSLREQSFWVNVERSSSLTAEHHEFLAKLRLIAQFDEQLKQFDKEKGAYLTGVALTEIRSQLYEEIEDLGQELELIPSFVEYLVKFHELYPTKTLRGLYNTLGVKLE